MALKGNKTKVNGDAWNANKRYRVGDLVTYNDRTYQNLTGINSEPSTASTDWEVTEDNTPVPLTTSRPVVFVNGNPFTLIKHPNNNTPGQESTIENNDFISAGFYDPLTYWPFAQCLDDTNTDAAASWLPIGAIEELTLI